MILLNILTVVAFLVRQAAGYGYAYTPRTRNYFAAEEGTSGQAIAGKPNTEYCPHVSIVDCCCGINRLMLSILD